MEPRFAACELRLVTLRGRGHPFGSALNTGLVLPGSPSIAASPFVVREVQPVRVAARDSELAP